MQKHIFDNFYPHVRANSIMLTFPHCPGLVTYCQKYPVTTLDYEYAAKQYPESFGG